MLSPVELQLSPSCQNCLSWSEDGELAIAASEYVHILTPRKSTAETAGNNGNDLSRTGTGTGARAAATNAQWHITRFRANIFTNREWPTIYPQNRDDFSIGAEQSTSTVAGIAWSRPGLAKYRRCTLAVLTSNLLMSFYEPLGPQGKWVRVAIVNESLKRHFLGSVSGAGSLLRKSNIRTFTWCPAFKVPSVAQGDGDGSSYAVPDPESRWGIQLLAVTNDDNDVILLEVRRSSGTVPDTVNTYQMEVLSVTSLQDQVGNFPMVQPVSVFASAIRSRVKILSIACGPWVQRSAITESVHSATTAIAVVYGTRLKVIKLDVNLFPREEPRYKLEASFAEHSITSSGQDLGIYYFTGPLQWLYTDEPGSICLAVGIFAGLITVDIPNSVYKGNDTVVEDSIEIREHPFLENTSSETEQDKPKHWEPISAMITVPDKKTHTSTLHIGTLGGYAATSPFPSAPIQNSGRIPLWSKKLGVLREQFDLDRDLGGHAITRIWGLASHCGLIAVATTMHPGDMIEYYTAAGERCSIIFSSGNLEKEEVGGPTFPKTIVDRSPGFLHERREAVYGLILTSEPDDISTNTWSQRLTYAAACCAILESSNEQLQSQAQKILARLSEITGADLSEEISKYGQTTTTENQNLNTISAKSATQLSGPGGRIFEKCDICDTGIAWTSALEARCERGHLFVRCGLTLLSIQEPGISKFCSVCDTEYLNEDILGSIGKVNRHENEQGDERESDTGLGSTFKMISGAFDTCVYCGGKFRP